MYSPSLNCIFHRTDIFNFHKVQLINCSFHGLGLGVVSGNFFKLRFIQIFSYVMFYGFVTCFYSYNPVLVNVCEERKVYV